MEAIYLCPVCRTCGKRVKEHTKYQETNPHLYIKGFERIKASELHLPLEQCNLFFVQHESHNKQSNKTTKDHG